ncbi:proteasome (prosome, macropain) assembly chaperone 4 [Chamberlinius hualienensis]
MMDLKMSTKLTESESNLSSKSSINAEEKPTLGSGTSSRLRLHQFSATILQTQLHFAVLKLKESFMVWISTKSSFPNLAVGMTINNDRETPATTIGSSIFGDIADPTSQDMAMRLAKKTHCQVFVSCAVQQSEPLLMSLVEKRLNEEIERLPEAFLSSK